MQIFFKKDFGSELVKISPYCLFPLRRISQYCELSGISSCFKEVDEEEPEDHT